MCDIVVGGCPGLSVFVLFFGYGLVTFCFLVSGFGCLDRDIYSEGFFKPRTCGYSPGAVAFERRRAVSGSVGTPLLFRPSLPCT